MGSEYCRLLYGILFSVGYSGKDIQNIQDIRKAPIPAATLLIYATKHRFTEIRSLKIKFMVKNFLKNLFCSNCDL